MRVVVVGSGGREHALADALGRTADVVVTPGNPGIPGSVATPPTDLDADLYVIGPEAPLVAGLADELRACGRLVFGPGRDGARLEGSKAYMKELAAAAGLPTARYASFAADQVDAALAFLDTLDGCWVVKTDGLAAGKGVLVTTDVDDARADVGAKLAGTAFGDAGRRVVIEEGLTGEELSVLLVCDGQRAVALPAARDYKRLGDADAGPNTGGMGAYSPVSEVGEGDLAGIVKQFAEPTLAELRRRGIDYRGVLYAGLMLTPAGPKLIEYNVRFGDPEAQVVLPRLHGDVAALLAEAAAGDVATKPGVRDVAAVTVVCSTEGYPVAPRTGDVIDGLDAAAALEGVRVYCAGVGRDPSGRLITAGGRVVALTGVGPTLAGARERAYAAVAEVSWTGVRYRTDIAASAEH